MLFWYQHAVYRSIITSGSSMSCRLPHEVVLLIQKPAFAFLLEQGLSACK